MRDRKPLETAAPATTAPVTQDAAPPISDDAPLPELSYSGDRPPVADTFAAAEPSASELGYDDRMADTGPILDEPHLDADTLPVNPRAEFDRLTRHSLKSADEPKNVQLPAAAQKGMSDAWQRSVADGHQHEQGGNLVHEKNGVTWGWHELGAGAEGAMKGADADDVGPGQTKVGDGHTHGYASGAEGVTFSGDDISSFATSTSAVEIVQSGSTQFMLARTAELSAAMKDLDDDQVTARVVEMEKMYNAAYAGPEPIAERAERAALKVCRAYHIAYYSGHDGNLTRVV